MTEPVVAVVFILAPFVLGFESSEARILSIVIGVVILVVGMSTRWRLSLSSSCRCECTSWATSCSAS